MNRRYNISENIPFEPCYEQCCESFVQKLISNQLPPTLLSQCISAIDLYPEHRSWPSIIRLITRIFILIFRLISFAFYSLVFSRYPFSKVGWRIYVGPHSAELSYLISLEKTLMKEYLSATSSYRLAHADALTRRLASIRRHIQLLSSCTMHDQDFPSALPYRGLPCSLPYDPDTETLQYTTNIHKRLTRCASNPPTPSL